ncbi:hypothetical protein ACFL4N_10000 [Thermodesulfobacteriota bacterium]
MRKEQKKNVMGVITSRQCPECGHHEVGFATEEGVFHPLRPGTIIQTQDPSNTRDMVEEEHHGPVITQRAIPESRAQVPWVPYPLWGHRNLCLKFGVFLEELDAITQEVYWRGYMEKLEYLISKEQGTPVPVILDRLFSAPHLASGEPGEIAERLWEDLEEIRKPVRQMATWLEKGDEESLRKMIHPIPPGSLEQGGVDRDLLQRELEALSLEGFLELL